MAKLYAEITSDKGGRVVGKGGDNYVTMRVKNGNIAIFDITFKDDGDKRGYLQVQTYSDASIITIPYMRDGGL